MWPNSVSFTEDILNEKLYFLCSIRFWVVYGATQVLQNRWEILVKEFFLIKFEPNSLQMQ